MKKSFFSECGFTAIELIVTIAIAAVLMAVAAPSFIGFQRNSELTSLTNKLLGSINTARGEAMKTGRNAFVIPANTTSWTSGWNVFVDMNSDNAYTEGTDILVQSNEAPSSFFEISGTNNAAASSPYISFDSSGYARAIGGSGLTNLTLSIKRTDVSTSAANEETRRIIVARTGKTRSCKPRSDSSCTTTQSS
ncbi:prepilin-type N-terminal cleavage/methylation domain-containing protein [Comamonas testosteroni]|uniref:Type II secretion system protein H n=1 Tax=Comamonas testosteroni TaxID=285 RepID=A0A373FCT8_COMTE|nr:GspH/FimT family pseudopilin [Comamonas testosteroni]RGE41807.1 prepilin-type N-terminal cleavage/methylation domain-containing protein [Comamonas testosteroni]